MKTQWEKEKLLVVSNFSFFPLCFQPFWRTFYHFYQFQNCGLQTLSLEESKVVVWDRNNKEVKRHQIVRSCYFFFREPVTVVKFGVSINNKNDNSSPAIAPLSTNIMLHLQAVNLEQFDGVVLKSRKLYLTGTSQSQKFDSIQTSLISAWIESNDGKTLVISSIVLAENVKVLSLSYVHHCAKTDFYASAKRMFSRRTRR